MKQDTSPNVTSIYKIYRSLTLAYTIKGCKDVGGGMVGGRTEAIKKDLKQNLVFPPSS